MAHLDDVRFAAGGPSHLVVVVAHQPECRPQSVGRLRHADQRVEPAVGEAVLALRIDASRGELTVLVVFARGCQDQAVAAALRFSAHADAPLAVVLQLVVAASRAIDLDVPDRFVECVAVELVGPYQPVAFGCVLRPCPFGAGPYADFAPFRGCIASCLGFGADSYRVGGCGVELRAGDLQLLGRGFLAAVECPGVVVGVLDGLPGDGESRLRHRGGRGRQGRGVELRHLARRVGFHADFAPIGGFSRIRQRAYARRVGGGFGQSGEGVFGVLYRGQYLTVEAYFIRVGSADGAPVDSEPVDPDGIGREHRGRGCKLPAGLIVFVARDGCERQHQPPSEGRHLANGVFDLEHVVFCLLGFGYQDAVFGVHMRT